MSNLPRTVRAFPEASGGVFAYPHMVDTAVAGPTTDKVSGTLRWEARHALRQRYGAIAESEPIELDGVGLLRLEQIVGRRAVASAREQAHDRIANGLRAERCAVEPDVEPEYRYAVRLVARAVVPCWPAIPGVTVERDPVSADDECGTR